MPSVQFDYTPFAVTYESRPDYAPDAIEQLFHTTSVRPGDRVCDIGAGSGHLTVPLVEYGLLVDAVEPNAAMRAIGERRTTEFPGVHWFEGVGEDTGRPEDSYSMVTFGSSFDRTDRKLALAETARLLRPGGFFACMWNHRDLTDPVQAKIEAVIHERIPGYDYGVRRQDPTPVIDECGLFGPVVHLKGTVLHTVDAARWCEAWRSHSTLGLQAGEKFDEIVDEIREIAMGRGPRQITVPYTTRIWMAQTRFCG